MIVFCGYANSDVTVHVPALPRVGERVQASRVHRQDGGMAGNAASAAARAGARCAFAGVLGTDALDEAFLDALAAEGVDTSWTARHGWLTTAVVLVGPDGDRSVISQDDEVSPEHVAATGRRLARAGGGLLYLEGYRFPWAVQALAGIDGLRCAVDLDGCVSADAAASAARLAEHVIAGPGHTALLGPDPALAAAEFKTTVVVTDGARGWRLFTPDGGRHAGPALEVDVVDTTGAGDCFTGSYLAAVEAGESPVAAAGYAAVAAGLSCTAPGARAAVPRPDRVREAQAGPSPAGTS